MAELVIAGLRVARGMREVVHSVDLTIPAGEVTALLGANGAGKSSLVLGVAGVIRPLGGTVHLDGTNVAGKAPHVIRRRGIAAVPEGHRVLTELSVRDNLAAAAEHRGRNEEAPPLHDQPPAARLIAARIRG